MALSPSPWWDRRSKATEPHTKLIALITSMRRMQAQRYVNMDRFVAAYEYGDTVTYGRSRALDSIDEDELKFNVAKNAVDTMHALLMAPKVAPMLLTEGGTWAQRDRAKKATQAIEGVMAGSNFGEIEERVVKDGLVCMNGFVRVDAVCDHDEMTAEIVLKRVIPRDVLVDEAEGRDGRPRCFYQMTMVDRYKLLADYGVANDELYGSVEGRRSAIRQATRITELIDGNPEVQNIDQVEVWEAWHLPSSPRSKDGRYTIAVSSGTLCDVQWDGHLFPVPTYRPDPAHEGFWGLSAMRDAISGQREHVRVTKKMQRAHRRMGGAHLIVGKGNINVRQLTNDQGTVIEANDINQVRDWTPTPVNPQTYQYREGIADDILRYMGLSVQTARMEVPAGMQGASGKALQTFQDTESKRLVLKHRARERFVVDVANAILDKAAELIDAGYVIRSRHADKTGYNDIDWSDIADVVSDRKKYMVRTFPVGMLSDSPPAKFAQLDALLERQAITVEQYKRLLGLPDLEAEADVDCADYEIVDKNLDYIVAKGRRVVMTPFIDPALVLSRGGKFYNYCERVEVPEDRLALLREYLLEAKRMMDEEAAKASAAAASAAPPPPMPMDPMMGAPPGPTMGGDSLAMLPPEGTM